MRMQPQTLDRLQGRGWPVPCPQHSSLWKNTPPRVVWAEFSFSVEPEIVPAVEQTLRVA